MKINADILYDRLKLYYSVEMMGSGSRRPLLECPELYIDESTHFRENHIYMATVEHLPARPVIERNVVLVCIGDSPRLNYYQSKCVVLLIRKRQDFFRVFRTLQGIYEVFSRWESDLLELVLNDPSVESVIRRSMDIFLGKIFVLDREFRYLASSLDNSPEMRSTRKLKLDPAELGSYLKHWDMNTEERKALKIPSEGHTALCVNLFDRREDYIGCVYILSEAEDFVAGEEFLAEHLARILERVMENLPTLADENDRMKEALRNMMNEMPLSNSQRMLLKAANQKQTYCCLSLHFRKGIPTMPMGYICSLFENLTEGNIFFPYNNSILGLIPVASMKPRYRENHGHDPEFLRLLDDMCLALGASNPFTDLYMLRIYYGQAEAAIENGLLFRPDQQIHTFETYALKEMVINSLGGLPVETYYPAGFRNLLDHDREGGISYLETLKCFLENNMSYTITARQLYIHRSTLMERMERIRKELGIDLSDSETCLHLRLLLKALEIEQCFRSDASAAEK